MLIVKISLVPRTAVSGYTHRLLYTGQQTLKHKDLAIFHQRADVPFFPQSWWSHLHPVRRPSAGRPGEAEVLRWESTVYLLWPFFCEGNKGKYTWKIHRTSLVAQLVKNPPAMQEIWVRSLSWEDPLEKGKATHSSILAWRIPWTV